MPKEARKWLFFMSSDLKSRASLDVNFCKMLTLMYIADNEVKNSEYNIPDINHLLAILYNNQDIKKESLFSLMITLKSLNYDISSNLWKNFYINDYVKFNQNLKNEKTDLFFILDESIKKRNLAEVILVNIDLLNSLDNKKPNFYLLYKSLRHFNDIGLRSFARNFGLELNLDF